MTTREVAAHYRSQSEHHLHLWKSAYLWVAEICDTHHRARARHKLQRLRHRYRHMASSVIFTQAARLLYSPKKGNAHAHH